MVKAVPEGFQTVTPYFLVKGASKFIDFLIQVFDATELTRFDRPDGSIMYAEVKVGSSKVMVADASEEYPAMPCYIHLYVDDADATYQRALQAGSSSLMEPADRFYGDRIGGVIDPFGNYCWIATHKEDLTHEEIQERVKAHH